jgi:hypothetical protein
MLNFKIRDKICFLLIILFSEWYMKKVCDTSRSKQMNVNVKVDFLLVISPASEYSQASTCVDGTDRVFRNVGF